MATANLTDAVGGRLAQESLLYLSIPGNYHKFTTTLVD